MKSNSSSVFVEALRAGDFSARIEVEGHDEVAHLARSFNQAAERIAHLVKAQRTMLASASHELRSPLTRIRMAVELVESRPELQQRLAQDIAELDALIGEILLASRLQALERVEATEEVDLLGLLAEEGVRVAADVSGTPVCFEGEPRLLRRLIRDFLRRAGWGSVGMSGLLIGMNRSRAFAHPPSTFPTWVPASDKTPKRGGILTRASAWDPPVLDPRLTNSVELFQIATLVYNRLIRYPYTDEAKDSADLALKGDLAEAWEGSKDFKTWTFKLRQGVKWHNVPPLHGRELVAEDIKYVTKPMLTKASSRSPSSKLTALRRRTSTQSASISRVPTRCFRRIWRSPCPLFSREKCWKKMGI